MVRFSDKTRPAPQKSAHYQQINAEIKYGIDMAADPVNANLAELAHRTTTINSPWFARTCRVCNDNFREGDLVRLCPDCSEPYHDDGQFGLDCWKQKFAGGAICRESEDERFIKAVQESRRCQFSWSQPLPNDRASQVPFEKAQQHTVPPFLLVSQFVEGVESVWRPHGEQELIRVMPGSPLMKRQCPWCPFRIRVGDWVTRCPCPLHCGTYFHQDVSRHLTCWNEWNGIMGRNYCPTTGERYTAAQHRIGDGN